MNRFEELTGSKIGKLTVTGYYQERRNGYLKTFHTCECECGKKKDIDRRSLLRKNHVKSCGCLAIEESKKKSVTHGMTKTNFHNIWISMKQRIVNENNPKYHNYGGRGIGISEEWLEFDNFKRDMYEKYLAHARRHGFRQTTLDRINPNGDYEKDNCRWATYEKQANNQQRHLRKFKAANKKTGEEFVFSNKKKCAETLGICPKHIGSVLNGRRKSSHGYTFNYID